jgi:hypothetical protein
MTRANTLNLKSVGGSATTGLFELTSLGSDVWFDTIVGVGIVDGGAVTEVANSLASTLATTEQNSVATLGGSKGKLIKGKAFTTSLCNAGSGISSEFEGTNGELWDFKKSNIVGDSSDNDGSLSILSFHVASQSRNGDWGLVKAGHTQSLGNNFSKF